MTQPLIQQLAERVNFAGRLAPDNVNVYATAKLLFELCAYLDEQAAVPPGNAPTARDELPTRDDLLAEQRTARREYASLQAQFDEARAELTEKGKVEAAMLTEWNKTIAERAEARAALALSENNAHLWHKQHQATSAERDTLDARVAALSVRLEDAVSAHNENLTRSFDSDMVLRDKLKAEQSAHDVTKRQLAEMTRLRDLACDIAHEAERTIAGMRAVVEAAREWRAKATPSSPRYDNAWWKLYDAVDALSALDQPAAAEVK